MSSDTFPREATELEAAALEKYGITIDEMRKAVAEFDRLVEQNPDDPTLDPLRCTRIGSCTACMVEGKWVAIDCVA